VSKDDSTYDTVFQTKSGDALILRVHIPPSGLNILGTSACKAPMMTLVGVRVTHPWVDSKMRVVGYSSIATDDQWTASGMKLGAAVNDVVRHLQLEPPTVIEITDESLKRLQRTLAQKQEGQSSYVSNSDAPSSANASNPQPSPPSYEAVSFHIPIPPIPESFPDLEDLPRSVLDELNEDDASFHHHFSQISGVATVKDLMTSIYKGNRETAESNLKKQEELETLYAEVQSLQNDLKSQIQTFETLQNENKSVLNSTHDATREIVRDLTKAKKEAFDQSEEYALNWIENNKNQTNIEEVDEFIKQFIEKRILHHTRAAKIEKLQNHSS